MKNPEVLDPANAAEAEMAAVAHQCLVTALDHSNADHINIILDLGIIGLGNIACSKSRSLRCLGLGQNNVAG